MSRPQPIATERLVLLALEPAHRARLIALANNWRVAKNLSNMPFPYTEASADDWLGKQDALWASGTSLNLAITLEGELIGGIGVGVRDHGAWELGYWLGEPYWNRGYATEAATAVRDHAFEALKLPLIVAGHYADNHASGRVLTKIGFRYTQESRRYSLALGREVRCLDLAMDRVRWLEVRQFRQRMPADA